MEQFSISNIINENIKKFVKSYRLSTKSQLVIKGLNFGNYYVLKGNDSTGYNFVSLDNNYNQYFTSNRNSIESCIKEITFEEKIIYCFNSFEELCKWYLEVANKK